MQSVGAIKSAHSPLKLSAKVRIYNSLSVRQIESQMLS
jgi:hypothetical protein